MPTGGATATIWGEEPLLYRVDEDPLLERNLVDENPGEVERLIGRAVDDAGGAIPDYFSEFKSRPGCTPYLSSRQLGPRRWD